MRLRIVDGRHETQVPQPSGGHPTVDPASRAAMEANGVDLSTFRVEWYQDPSQPLGHAGGRSLTSVATRIFRE